MKRRWMPATSAWAAVVLLTAGSAVAQQGKPEATPSGQESVDKTTPQQAPPDQAPPDQAPPTDAEPGRNAAEPAGPGAEAETPQARAAQRGAAPLLRLQTVMKKGLVLSKEQEKRIDELFRDELRTLKTARDPHRPANVDREVPEELTKLRDQIAAAREAGDLEAVRKLREEYHEKLRSRPIQPGMNFMAFVERVAAELTDEQRPVFLDLARQTARSPNYPVQLTRDQYVIWRAVHAPEVGVSATQKKEILAILRGAHGDAGQSPNDAQTAKTTEEIRAEISEKLTPEQRVKLEAAINVFSGKARREAATTPDQSGRTEGEAGKDKDTPPSEGGTPNEDEPN